MLHLLPMLVREIVLTFYSGYNPPQYVLDAAKDALNNVDCNQYAPVKVRLNETSEN